MLRQICLVGFVLIALVVRTSAQSIVIDGVTDRSTYTDSATFRVQTNAAFTYLLTLNGVPIPAGVSNTIANAGTINYIAQLQSLTARKPINMDISSTQHFFRLRKP